MNKPISLPKFGYIIGIAFSDGTKDFIDFLQFKPLNKKDLRVTKEQKKRGITDKWQIKVEIKEVTNE
jgi:hypothetical protein